MEIKHGQIWINTGFEAAYKSKFYHSIIRILKVDGNKIVVRSVADSHNGEFTFGGYLGEPFSLEINKDFISGHFRPYKSGDLDKFLKARICNRILYGK